jgi:oligopeptide/dipeptide ABC transporter ATP-binding protein
MKSETVLSVQSLRLDYETLQARTHALNGVDLEVRQGEVVGVVGESGSGKSTLALAIIGLLPSPPAKILPGGRILFEGQDILAMGESQLEGVRGTGISMIFQEPLTSLNPIFTIGDQVAESVRVGLERRTGTGKPEDMEGEAKRETISWLGRVGLPDPASTLGRYPHELSGGMRQRVMIAMAMAARPSLILADEPTSAVDVTTQAQILKLMRSLIDEARTSVLFISHDLAVVAQVADRAAVMYAGMVVEEAPVSELFENPLHPYTKALLGSLPRDDARGRLESIPGMVPNLANIPSGCPFHPRCGYAMDICSKERPKVMEVRPGHRVACVLY